MHTRKRKLIRRRAKSLLLLITLMIPFLVAAQPAAPELSIALVRDADGAPMRGPYAPNTRQHHLYAKRGDRPWTVEQHFTVSGDYPYSTHEVGAHKSWPLVPDTIRDRRTEHLQFRILDCWCVDQYLLVVQGLDTMRIDVPDPGDLRRSLVHYVVRRSGQVASPEVVRYRPGHYTFAQVANNEAHSALETKLAERAVADRSRPTRRERKARGR